LDVFRPWTAVRTLFEITAVGIFIEVLLGKHPPDLAYLGDFSPSVLTLLNFTLKFFWASTRLT